MVGFHCEGYAGRRCRSCSQVFSFAYSSIKVALLVLGVVIIIGHEMVRLRLGLDVAIALHVLLKFLDEFEFEWHIAR